MPEQTESRGNAWSSRAKWVFAVFAVMGGFFLIAEHRAHVLPYLPWIILAACPLLHMFMHGSHGGHGRHGGHGGGKRPDAGNDGSDGARPEGFRAADAAGREDNHLHPGGRS